MKMAGKIALLAWGSLLWEGGAAFDAEHEPWQYGGPLLRIEFSRISSSRNGALTLVIDPEKGSLVRVAWCLSRRSAISEVIEDLRQRERTSPQNIGRVSVAGESQCRDKESLEAIRSWAAQPQLGGVVWTDLRGNFAKQIGAPFSIDAAKRYLRGLQDEHRTKALEYIRRAPAFVRTPLRDALADDLT